ncbi:MAG: YwiC-like family protein [Anaerolineae bacterium]
MTTTSLSRETLFRRHLALPQQHGAWAMLGAPLLVGLGVGRAWRPELLWLLLAVAGGFLALQPLTILTKSLSGRRARSGAGPALVWLAVYGLLALAGLVGLIAAGDAWILWLAVLALPVLAWQMWLVARRAERGQMAAELVGSGVLCLAAPAAYGVSVGGLNATALWLWLLCWLQAAGGVVTIYLALQYRRMKAVPDWPERRRLAWRATLYNVANPLIVAALGLLGVVPLLAVAAFLPALVEALVVGLWRPPVGVKPAIIGAWQTGLTLLFAALLIAAYWRG